MDGPSVNIKFYNDFIKTQRGMSPPVERHGKL